LSDLDIFIQIPKRSYKGVVTYSPAYTIVPTYECFNRCSYCNFRIDPGQSPWLSLESAGQTLQSLPPNQVIEILILSGEVHPQSPRRSAWLQRIVDLCQLALSLGFLPHTNAGPLSLEEMALLKSVNISMGLMLEQVTPQLLQTVHQHAPSKVPELRLQQLQWAGELQIPFTTGLLLGIGETELDRQATLAAIAQIQDHYGHIQEVILQPHRPGQDQSWPGQSFQAEDLITVVAQARQILPAEITIQVPPNLFTDPAGILAAIEAGARDLGGIGPIDEVNPDYPHLQLPELTQLLNQAGWLFKARLPVYPAFDRWVSPHLQPVVAQLRQSLG
jgi:7,8-didemethyl-8-hydroxy-5-deazariboflavin synthase